MLPFGLTDEQRSLGATLSRWAADMDKRVAVGDRSDPDLWQELADLGVLALGTSDGGGGAVEIVLAIEQLGAVAFPGPLPPTFASRGVLSASDLAAVSSGTERVGVGPPTGPIAWASGAKYLVVVDGARMAMAEAASDVEPAESLSGELWCRGALRPISAWADGRADLATGDAVVAAYVTGAGRELIRRAAEYATQRQQFGRPIGDNQGVAFPLAEVHAALEAAQALTFMAADALDHHDEAAIRRCAAARHAAVAAATEAGRVAHQTLGGLGYAMESPIALHTRRIQDVALALPSSARVRDAILDSEVTP